MAFDLFWLGALLAIVAGANNSIGTILQKQVVNSLKDHPQFGTNLVKNPKWLLGIIMQLGLSTILIFIVQGLIGPALVPGLMASGLIVLAIGSIRLLKESLRIQEISGIILMILGVTFLGLSRLEISISETLFTSFEFSIRNLIFTGSLFGLTIAGELFRKIIPKQQSIIMILQGGLLLGISNLWISILLGTIEKVFMGQASWQEIILFVSCCIILVGTNMFCIALTQKAFCTGQANKLIPIQMVPSQIAPIASFFFVFNLPSPFPNSILFSVIGIGCILGSAVFLAQRQAQINGIEEPSKKS